MLLGQGRKQTDCASCMQRLIESMDGAGVDVIVYPTWSNVARLVGDYISPDGAPQRHLIIISCSTPSWAPATCPSASNPLLFAVL